MGKVRRRSDGAKSFDECELRGVADAEIRCERGDEDGSRWRRKVREVGVRALVFPLIDLPQPPLR